MRNNIRKRSGYSNRRSALNELDKQMERFNAEDFYSESVVKEIQSVGPYFARIIENFFRVALDRGKRQFTTRKLSLMLLEVAKEFGKDETEAFCKDVFIGTSFMSESRKVEELWDKMMSEAISKTHDHVKAIKQVCCDYEEAVSKMPYEEKMEPIMCLMDIVEIIVYQMLHWKWPGISKKDLKNRVNSMFC